MCGTKLSATQEMRRRRESMQGSATEKQAQLLSGIVYNDNKHVEEFMKLPKWIASHIIESVTPKYFEDNKDSKVVQAGPYGLYEIKH